MNAGKIAIAVLGKHREGLFLIPMMEEIPLEQMRRQASLFFLSRTADQQSCLCTQTLRFLRTEDSTELCVSPHLSGLLLELGTHALGKSLSCFLTEALLYPKSAKTCKVQAGLECYITNNVQQYSFIRDILLSVTI